MFKQISFSDEHKKLPAGQYTIKIYDDEAYTVLRKVNAAVSLFVLYLGLDYLVYCKIKS